MEEVIENINDPKILAGMLKASQERNKLLKQRLQQAEVSKANFQHAVNMRVQGYIDENNILKTRIRELEMAVSQETVAPLEEPEEE